MKKRERPVLAELDVSMTQTAILQSSTQELDASLDRVGAGIDALVAENARLRAALRECFEALIQAQPYVGEAGAGAKLLDMLEHADQAARAALGTP